ncbi:UNVERIFIED_CONTAM: hypothetical protein FKN15_037338, partial [Acipenser sinensis]
ALLNVLFRRDSSEPRAGLQKLNKPTTVMQTDSNTLTTQAGNGLALTLQPESLTSTPGAGDSGTSPGGEVHIPIGTTPAGERGGRPASRRPRSHAHSHARPHSHSEPDSSGAGDLDAGEPSSSISELRYLLRWLQKSLPFIVILCAKLVMQHALGIAIGVGLLTTFLYANKMIQNQVFLRPTTVMQTDSNTLTTQAGNGLALTLFSSFPSLIFLNPSVESLGLWDVLWIVGITNFILKFLFMGMKCLLIIMPSALVAYRSRHNGVLATKNQCAEAGDDCPICQAEFREPCLLACQHMFCDECISLWLNREKTCPLCRTVIADSVHKWKDGATSMHLQIY